MTNDGPGAQHEVRNEMSGRAEGVVQAGLITGDVHLHVGQADQLAVPRQLLPSPVYLVGRQREMWWLDQVRADPSASPVIVILKGSGGVGKTALATQWFRQSERYFPDGQLYVNLTDATGDPVAPEDVLGQFLRALGIDSRNVPAGLAERAALFRSVTAQRALAVLLDNAVSAAQARMLVPASPTSMVLVTSRRTLFGLVAAGALVLDVLPLDPDSAVELLVRRLGHDRVGTELGDVQELASLCGGLPIALSVVAAMTLGRPNRLLARTVRDLREEQQRLNRLSMDRDSSVRAALDASYNGLSVVGAATYRAMGLHPGTTFDVRQVAAATDVDIGEALAAMDELADANLVEELRDGYYRFHDLIRVHAREQAAGEDDAVIRRLLEWYLKATQASGRLVMPSRRVLLYEFDETSERSVIPDDTASRAAALRWLEDERLNLVAAVHVAAGRGFHALAYSMADALQPLVIVHRHYRTSVEMDPFALRSAQTDGNHDAELDIRKRLARYLARLGYLSEAARHADLMLAAARANGDRRGETKALESKAVVLVEAGEYDSAVTAYERALAILAELHRPRAEALMSTDLGDVLLTLGRWSEAITRVERARTLLVDLPEPDVYNIARAVIVLARAYVGAGNDLSARDLLRSALSTMAEHGSGFQSARAHRSLADIARRAGDDDAAARHAAAADRLASGADDPVI
jgi:tetratricopeptide (TPR) repeat protein